MSNKCALQNSCSRIGKGVGERLWWSPVLETLSCNFNKTGLHHWHFPRNFPTFLDKQFHKTTSERLIGKGVHLFSMPNHHCFDMYAFRILVKSHKPISKFPGKNHWWSSLTIKLLFAISVKENSITCAFLFILLNFSEQLH